MGRNRLQAVILSLLAGLCLMSSGSSFSSVNPDLDDKCPVCGMFVAKYPDWLAQVQYEKGDTVFFDGPKDLFRYLFNREYYRDPNPGGDIRAILVTDYYGLEPIEAREALFVIGADVYGPMGRELIPFSTVDAAREFKVDHRGEEIVLFGQITEDVIRSLD